MPAHHEIIPSCPLPPDGRVVRHLPFGHDAPWLAPLAGYSDLPFRLLCRRYGAAVCVTEMVSAKGLAYNSTGTGELLRSLPRDQPLVVQLFGAEACYLEQAISRLRAAGYAWFDLNMGCSVPKVLKQQAGAAMLGDIDHALDVARAMIRAAEPGHVGFKFRLGLDDSRPVWMDLALRLEDAGAGWLTLHPRTARQGFGGEADHTALARLSERLSLPLLASGDLFTAADGVRVQQQTGVSGVMYARGALSDPTIFAAHRALAAGQPVPEVTPQSLRAVIDRHIALCREHCSGNAALWKMRSVVPRYVKQLPGAKALRRALCQCTSWEDLDTLLDEHLTPAGPAVWPAAPLDEGSRPS